MNRQIRCILVLLLIFAYYNIWACSCFGESDIKESFDKSDIVFIGKVISIQEVKITQDFAGTESFIDRYYSKVTLSIEQLYKGNLESNKVVVFTGVGGGDCGYHFDLDKIYVVYANKWNRIYYNGDKVSPYFYTDICQRTTEKIVEEKKKLKIIFRF